MVTDRAMQPVKILLVEDDPADVELTREVLEQSKIRIDLEVAEDGVEALKYLRRESPYDDAALPDIILLDLNMPKMDGRDVLKQIKSDENLKMIPVVVLTTSSTDEDIVKSYTLGANCYVTKPVGLAEFAKVVDSVEAFWFTVVKLPATR